MKAVSLDQFDKNIRLKGGAGGTNHTYFHKYALARRHPPDAREGCLAQRPPPDAREGGLAQRPPPDAREGGLAQRPPPDARKLAVIGRDARQQGNPPDPDLSLPNPTIPDARDIGGHRKSTTLGSFPRGRAISRPAQKAARCPRTCGHREETSPRGKLARHPKHKQDP